MKRVVSLLLAALLLLSLGACGQKAAADDAVRIVGRYKVVPNDNERKDTYPYVLRTENSAWYLAAADIDLMGEEAFYKGLEDILSYAEADMTDARKALTGRIWEDVPPVEIRTDFCGKAEISQDAGAYYNGLANMIKLFHSWDMAKFSLLHEYVHYLTIHCAEKKTMHYFYIETVAEYVSKFVCENRMIRSIDFSNSDQPELNALAEIWDDFDQVKYRNACLSESDAFARGLYDERPYSCVGQYTTALLRGSGFHGPVPHRGRRGREVSGPLGYGGRRGAGGPLWMHRGGADDRMEHLERGTVREAGAKLTIHRYRVPAQPSHRGFLFA